MFVAVVFFWGGVLVISRTQRTLNLQKPLCLNFLQMSVFMVFVAWTIIHQCDRSYKMVGHFNAIFYKAMIYYFLLNTYSQYSNSNNII